MAKKLPKTILAIIFLLVTLVMAGVGVYKDSIETTQISWLLEKMGEDDRTGAPLMRVRIDFKGKTNIGYDVGTYTGDCFEITKSKWELLEQEISGVICGWSDWGDEVGLFKEGDKFVIKHGTLGSGRPATVDEPAIPNIRGDFKPLLEIKIEGWLPYEFGKTDYAFKKPFRLFYPPSVEIVKSSEFSFSEYSPSPPDKLLFEIDNKKCWLIILPPGIGIEEPPPDFSSKEGEIEIARKKWETLIWKVKDKVTFYGFYHKDDTNYSFSVNPENLDQCLDTYKQILSTFEFTEQLTGEPSSAQTEQIKVNPIVEEIAQEVINLLKDKNLEKLSTFIYPTKGVRFSPYTYVNVQKDQKEFLIALFV